MAIVDRPLYSDAATGKIRKTLTFFKREVWDRVSSIAYHKQVYSPAQQAIREAFSAAAIQWQRLTQEEKDVYNAYATGMQTGYNVFIQEALMPVPCPPVWFEDLVDQFPLTTTLKLWAQAPCPSPLLTYAEVTGYVDLVSLPGPTLTFSYSIT